MKYKNLLKGIPWRFGPNWPGKRCEAKTRKGTPCYIIDQRPAKLPVGRWLMAVEFTEVQAQDLAQKPVLRALCSC